MPLKRVATLGEIPDNGSLALKAGSENLLLVKSASGVFAIENMCSHAYQQLEGGKVRKVHIFCPMHGVRFDMRNGTPAGDLDRQADQGLVQRGGRRRCPCRFRQASR